MVAFELFAYQAHCSFLFDLGLEMNRKKLVSVNPLYVGATLTALYVLVIGLVVVHPAAVDATNRFQYYGGMSLADLGSFLSGVFAPIAFLWLVVAVAIQSQELASQRRELELTRLEFEENRKVATAQAEFVGKQTEILEHGRRQQSEEAQDRLVEARVAALSEWVKRMLSQRILVHIGGGMTLLDTPAEVFKNNENPAAQLLNLARLIRDLNTLVTKHVKAGSPVVKIEGLPLQHIGVLRERLRELSTFAEVVTDEWKANLKEADLSNLIAEGSLWDLKVPSA
ncbi:MAG: hypothetical protein E5V63_09230 [Mesorhizobium sp.]|nr:MAG: hypothetical protein E5V63_09230 [Mesorhizobium sp.]